MTIANVYADLKAAMKAVGHTVSEGASWTAKDASEFKDFCHFTLGIADNVAHEVIAFPGHFEIKLKGLITDMLGNKSVVNADVVISPPIPEPTPVVIPPVVPIAPVIPPVIPVAPVVAPAVVVAPVAAPVAAPVVAPAVVVAPVVAPYIAPGASAPYVAPVTNVFDVTPKG